MSAGQKSDVRELCWVVLGCNKLQLEETGYGRCSTPNRCCKIWHQQKSTGVVNLGNGQNQEKIGIKSDLKNFENLVTWKSCKKSKKLGEIRDLLQHC
jgi:hypothetical protein